MFPYRQIISINDLLKYAEEDSKKSESRSVTEEDIQAYPLIEKETSRYERRYSINPTDESYSKIIELPNGEQCFMQRVVNKPWIIVANLETQKTIGTLIWDEHYTQEYKEYSILVIYGERAHAIQVDPEYRGMGIGELMIQFAMDITGTTSIKTIGPQTEEGQRLFRKFPQQ